ncbi:hypothetical protein AU255_08345 [Methyloprofundus sedimenti]|uniref:Uncharacterized protein n=1 Tax=Methyloprofundus sedimenti TaxID=1420851 RepID=A0A1V8M8J0_9GAMM|nr:hypothetical protein [Methyloprofundus sedimenti]OQK17857.1 hypothetical protein AU255_08345 [Methyloprofundus sedimenti]
MIDSEYFYDRKFKLLLEDSVFLLKMAIETSVEGYSPKEWSLVRSSIYSSSLLLESAANCCISTLSLSSKYLKDIDKLPVLSKFEYYLQQVNSEMKFDRGCLPVQQASELINTRNLIVHPKPYKNKWVKKDENTKSVDLGETAILKLPKSFFVLKNTHGLVALKAAMSFLNYFFIDLCKYTDNQVRNILVSDIEYPPPSNVSFAHNPDWIWLNDEWGVDVDFLIDVKMVKDANKRFREHLRSQEK